MTPLEQEVEQSFIQRLTGLGCEPVKISNAEDLKTNLKAQLEKHNKLQLSDPELQKKPKRMFEKYQKPCIRPPTPQFWGTFEPILIQSPPELGDLGGGSGSHFHFSNIL